MANLPPRPESPLRMPPREERRHLPDERDRDRRSAQPMAPRFRGERFPERERSYMPRPRLDTYIAPGFDSRREPDRRDFDDRATDRDRPRRDFDRDRETRERDRRNWERQQRDRERERSPRRWNSPERDRRPYDRDIGPPRRPLSPPRRPGPRRSRSPLPRRRFSRSPPPHYRGRNRTRSRSRSPYHSPPPHKRIRLGNHSIAASPRSRSSRSPNRRRSSRERSQSPNRRDAYRHPSLPRESEQKEVKPELAVPGSGQDVLMDTTPIEQPTTSVQVKLEEPSSTTTPLPENTITTQSEPSKLSNNEQETLPIPPIPASEETKSELKPERKPDVLDHSQPKIEVEPHHVASPSLPNPSVIAIKKAEEVADIKMDNVDLPKPSAMASNTSGGSASPMPSPIINDYNRGPPTGPRWAQGRSPPRGPRHHPRSMPTSQTSAAPHQSTPRGPRRDFRSSTSSYPNATIKSGPALPTIPRYVKPPAQPPLADLETELARIQHHRANLTVEHFQQVKSARRALQELDIATIDLQSAENRRRIADMQLEKAKSGSLGIDAPPTDFGI